MLGFGPVARSLGEGPLRYEFAWMLVVLYAPPALAVLASGYLTRAWPGVAATAGPDAPRQPA